MIGFYRRGLPYGTRTTDRGTPSERSEHRRLAILWPIKYLTVLFHEVRNGMPVIVFGLIW